MKDFLKYADVFYGNGEVDHFEKEGLSSKWFYIKALCGNTVPHAVLPFGKISVGAYSGGYPTGYGTHYPNSCGGIKKLGKVHKIRGFSHIHHSGTGAIGYYYNYAVAVPFYGDRENINNYYPLESESGKPGYYEAYFNGVMCRLTVNKNVAVHNYKFKKNGGRLAIDFSNDGLSKEFGENYSACVKKENFAVMPDGKICFEGIFSGVKLYFAVEVKNARPELFQDDLCAVFDFDSDEIEAKVSYSTIDFASASDNIDSLDKSFEETAADASDIWREYLSAIEIETDNEELKKKFYSNLYHSLIKPTDMSGESILGIKNDLTGDLATFWDQYKTLIPMIMLIYPDMGKKIADCIVNISRTLKRIPCSLGLSEIFSCEEQAKMLGIFMLLDAYYVGLAKAETVEECIKRELERDDFKSFITDGVFERYTHITDAADACLSVACITADKALEKRLRQLAENWVKAYDKDGLMSKKSLYYEGDRYTYSFRLLKNMGRRIELAGGNDKFIKMLDDFFGYNGDSVEQITELDAYEKISSKHYHRFEGFNNECDMETPYAYIYAGRQDRTCEIVHESIMKSFGSGKGGLPGNNDSGGLSSCFVWNVLGIFPVSGAGEFLLGSPHIKSATIKLTGGNILEIETRNLSDEKFYADKVMFNDKEIKDFRIKTKELLRGGKLVFFMK